MTLVWDRSTHSGGELLVLLALADYAGEDGVAWPSVRTLARKSRLKERQVQYCLRSLAASGEIEILSLGSGRASSRYKLNFEGRKIDTPAMECTPAVQPVAPNPSGNRKEETPLIPLETGKRILAAGAAEIYAAYPRKAAKPAALRAIVRALKREKFDYLLERTKAFAKAWNGASEVKRHFIPHPATWFNQERYNDSPKEWVAAAKEPPRVSPPSARMPIQKRNDLINKLNRRKAELLHMEQTPRVTQELEHIRIQLFDL